MSLRDDNDNSYKLTADYRLRAVMKLQFFCFLQIRQQRMMIYLSGDDFPLFILIRSVHLRPTEGK